MSRRATDLAERFQALNNEVVAFVETCTDDQFRTVCGWEEWSVGVVALHIGAGHYQITNMARMIINNDPLPELTMEKVTETANRQARENAGCTREEVLAVLRENGESTAGFIAGLDDDQLEKTGNLDALGGEITVQKLLELVIFQSAVEHFENMKKAVGKV